MIAFFNYNEDFVRSEMDLMGEIDGNNNIKLDEKFFKISQTGIVGEYIQDENVDIEYPNLNWDEDQLVIDEIARRLDEINDHSDKIESPFLYDGRKFSGKPKSWRGVREAIARPEPGYEFPLTISDKKGFAYIFADQAAWDAFDDDFYARRKYIMQGERDLKIQITGQSNLAGLAAIVDNRV